VSNPETLETASNLATLLCTAGRASEAEVVIERFKAQNSSVPRFALVAATVHQASGRLSLAEFALRLARRETQELATEHPDNLALTERLGEILLLQHGQSISSTPGLQAEHLKAEEALLQEAELLFRQGRNCGSSRSSEGLAQVLLQRALADGPERQLRLTQAEDLLRKLTDGHSGSKRSSFLARRASLAFCLQLQGQLNEAAETYRQVLPDYIRWANNALATAKAGQWKQPIVLGATPLGAASAAANCAQLGGPQEALPLLRWSLNVCRAILARDHPTANCVARSLHRVLLATGPEAEALALEEEFDLHAQNMPSRGEPHSEARGTADLATKPEALLTSWPSQRRARLRWRSSSVNARQRKPAAITCCAAARRMFSSQRRHEDAEVNFNEAAQACDECKLQSSEPGAKVRSASCPPRE